ncbi:uncharacterized protein LOC110838457 [Zootermopsis nevadensis]|uniref:uncharacterized protein LOC110838457 n=1 Tax=Zootermopsis nevadensis TaxID=136037 RepID=UPI000B8EA740|nr:uncharacterized protein LOC110838457 [Zootermopsis nevadensis]
MGVGHWVNNPILEKDDVQTLLRRGLGNMTPFGRRGKRKKDMILATWNIGSLRKPGALARLKEELGKYIVDIAAVQDMRWNGGGIMGSGEYTVCYSGQITRAEFGTGFLVHRSIKTVNERMCTLRIRGRFFNSTLICVHAPTEDKE